MPTGILSPRDILAMPSPHAGGRPRATDDPIERAKHVRCLVYRVHDRKTVRQVAEIMGICERTVWKYCAWALTYVGEPEVAVIRAKIAENQRQRRQRQSA